MLKTVYVCYYHYYKSLCIEQVFETKKQAKAWVYRKNKLGKYEFDYQIVNFKPLSKRQKNELLYPGSISRKNKKKKTFAHPGWYPGAKPE